MSIGVPAQVPTPGNKSGSVDELVGLWKAKQQFGFGADRMLIIRKTGETYTADLAGRVLSMRVEKGEISFSLPDAQGTFSGKLQKSGILGHWVAPGTPLFSRGGASPIFLRPDGPNRWRGVVTASQSSFTFYLLAQKRPDGTIGVVLRNPERDIGTQQGARELRREGNVIRLIGARQNKEREISSGTFDAENDQFTLSFPNRGGTFDFRRESDESDFYPRGKTPTRYTYGSPTALDDGWATGTLADANIDGPSIARFIQKLIDTPMDNPDAPQIHSILIARHGRLVLEEYFHGYTRDMLHDTRSASKSVTSTLVGAAIQAGVPLALSSPVYKVMNDGAFPAGLEERKRAMTLEHLLTNSSGYYCDDGDDNAPGNEETMGNQTEEPDYYRYTLNVPMATPPGERSVYCSANPNLALGMVGRAAGESPMYTFDRLIGAPMKITRYGWSLDPAGNPYGGGSTSFVPRDFLKFGQLLLNGGMWQGRRILGKEFAARAGSPLYHLAGIYYGYNWWSEEFPYKNRKVHAFMALGTGDQMITVVPELDLVIGVFGANYASRVQFDVTHNWVPRYILPSVREPGDDKSAPVVDREYTSPYGRSKDGSRVTRPDLR
jgi:CubicO group peptidase (beta-lactamase class C family)